jgi:spermidine synthase
MKSEIRNPKSDRNPQHEIHHRAACGLRGAASDGLPSLRTHSAQMRRRSSFGSRACFGFRFSAFGFALATPLLALLLLALPARAGVIYETTTPYHHIRVLEAGGERQLCFDDATQSKINLADPLKGHFEYSEIFQMAVLWNPPATNVLMIGLGGGSAQRSFEQCWTNMTVETVEIDPMVRQVATNYFKFVEGPRQKVHIQDGRMFLRRGQSKYGIILVDAYVQGRYGSAIPYHLATKEFFQLAAQRLGTNGVLAYNVIGTTDGWQADIVGSVYQTMKEVFPHVSVFTCVSSLNVVLVGSTSPVKRDYRTLQYTANALRVAGKLKLPSFLMRLGTYRDGPPRNAANSPILTDDFAPVDGLLSGATLGKSGKSPDPGRSPAPR